MTGFTMRASILCVLAFGLGLAACGGGQINTGDENAVALAVEATCRPPTGPATTTAAAASGCPVAATGGGGSTPTFGCARSRLLRALVGREARSFSMAAFNTARGFMRVE